MCHGGRNFTHTVCLLWDNVKLLNLVVQLLLLLGVLDHYLTLVGLIHAAGK